MRFVPIGQEEEKPGLRFVPLSQPTEEAPALVSPEEMLTPVTPTAQQEELERLTKQYEAEVPFTQRVVDPLKRGAIQLTGLFPGLDVAARQKEINRLRAGEVGRTDPMTGEFIPLAPEEIEAAIKLLEGEQTSAQKKVMEAQTEAAKIRQRPAVEAIGKAKTMKEALEAFSADPLGAAASVALESSTQMAPALILAAVTRNPTLGAAALGGTSYATELSSSVYEYFQEQGVNLSDPEAVKKALNDPKLFQDAVDFAQTRARIIGGADVASAGLASRMLVPKGVVATPTARELVNIGVAQPASQMISGAGGEAAAQLATYGEVRKPGEVLLEAAGEGPTSVLETAAFGGQRIYDEYKQRAQPPVTPVTPAPAGPTFVPLEAEPAVKEPAAPAAPVTPPVTAVTEEEEGPMFTEELVTEREVREAKPAVTPVTPVDQKELDKLKADLVKVQAKQLDPTLSLDDPKLVEYQQQEADIRAKIDAASGVTPVTESLYDRLIKASPTELKKIEIPTSEAPDLYLRASEDENASPALVKKLTKIVNEMEPGEFKTEEAQDQVTELVKPGRIDKTKPDYIKFQDTIKDAPITFKTESESEYGVLDDGGTIRYKAPRPEHPGDQGLKTKSSRTIYVDNLDQARFLSAAGIENIEDPRVIFYEKNGTPVATLIHKNLKKDAATPYAKTEGKPGETYEIPFYTEPAIGRYPVELWARKDLTPDEHKGNYGTLEAYTNQHSGNKIVELSRKPEAEKPVTPVTKKPKKAPKLAPVENETVIDIEVDQPSQRKYQFTEGTRDNKPVYGVYIKDTFTNESVEEPRYFDTSEEAEEYVRSQTTTKKAPEAVAAQVISTEEEAPKQLSDAEKVTIAEELLDGLRFGDTIDLDNQKNVQELLGISRGFDAPVARRLMAIAKVPKAIQDKVMKQRPTTIDELSEFIAPLSKESAARAKDEKLFAQAKELAKTDEDVRQALDIYQSYKNMMEAIATERGKYGVKWAERNVSARWMEQSQKAKKAKQRVIDLMKIKPAVKKPAEKSKVEIKEEKAKANQLRQEVQKEIAKNYERDLEIDPSAGEILGNIKTINKFKVYKVKYGSETQYRVQSPFNRAMNRIGRDDSYHSDLGNARAKAEGSEALTPEQFVREKEYYAERAAREAAPKVEEEVTPVTPEVEVKTEPATEAKKEEHIEDGEAEPITKPVIQEAVTKGADKKDIDYTAMRREVERQVDEAIAKSPYETEKDWDATYSSRQNFVTFSIPGDGKFKVKNNKERLEEFKKKLMASVKPKAAKGPQLAIAPADVNTTLRDLVDSNDIQSAIEFAALKGVKISESKLDLKQKLKVKEYMEDPDAFERKVAAEAELTEAQRQAMAEAEEKRRIETNKRLAEEQEKRERDWINARYDDLIIGSSRTVKNILDKLSKDDANKILDKIDISEDKPSQEIIEALQKIAGTYVETRWKEFVNKIDSPLEIARVTKKLFEKYSTKEGSIPLHKLVEKEVDGGSTIITMESGERRLGDAAGYLSEKKIGTVGMDYAGFLLSRKPKGKKEIPLENISLAQIDRSLPGAKKRLPPGRSPELTAAAAQVKDGTMSAAEYDELVNKYKPIPVYTEAMKPATPEQVFDALDVAKRDKINPKIANGTPVGLRLDIPAFNRKGVFVVSIHKKRTPSAAGPVIGYGSVAKVTDATFGLGKETKALDIAAGASKDVLQTIEGKWNNISPEQAYKEAQEAINNPEWVQIGIDPTRHSYFYDRRTTLPIVKADEVIQIGNMLLGKGVEFGKKEDFLYNIESGPQLTERVIFEGISNARKQQLDELGRLARKKSELIKKIRNYGSDIETQRLLNELQDQIKIYRSGTAAKEPVTSAETFLKHARDAIDGTGMFREKSLDPEVFAVIQAAYIKTPWVLEGLRLSIKTPKQEGRASGIFIPMDRIVRLYRGTEGVEDPNTVRHELMHSLEQMMTGGAKDAVIQAWAKAFERAIKKYTDKKSQEYFKRVMDFLETPSAENRDKATEALPSYELYQYINPSEYWAVNAEKLYASQLGTAWDRFKKAIKKLFEGLKSVFGFNNTYAVHKLFDQIMGSAPGRMNRSSLTDYLLAGKAKIDFLENVQDDQKLIDKYKRPQTPMLNTEPVKNFVVNQARFAKAFFKDAVANPVEAIDTLFNGMSRGVHYLRNKNIFMGAGLEVADQEKYGGMLRNSQGLAIASVALDNALHSPNIATQVIFRGGIKFNKKAGVFVAAKNDTDTSMLGVYKAEAKLKEKLGAQLGTDIIQGYLEAKRSRSIKEELAVRDQELENLRNQLDSMDPADPDYENVRNQVNQAVDDLLAIKKAADKINMSDEEIAEFIDREKVHPELREIMDNFTGTNQNLLKFWYQVGLLSEGRYKALSKIKDYVPWYRIMDDEEDIHSPVQSTTRSMTNIGKEKLFKSGKPKTVVDFVAEDNQTEFRIQPSSVVKVKVNGVEVQNYTANAKGEITFSQPLAQGDVVVIETAREIENMIDNMTRNVMRMTMNGLRQYASTRIVQEYASRNEKNKIMVFPKADRNKGRFDYIANGRRVVVEIKDPLVAEAIFGMENIGLETFKAFAAVANMTRRMITMNPLFQVKQVFKDGPSAAFITGVKNPYGMVADVYTSFIKALKGDDETVAILRAAGIGGFQSPTRTPEAEIKRKIGVINKSNYDIVMAALDQFGDSSDVAQRKAIYDRVMKETGDEMRAIYQASTIMPFHRHGSGRVAQAIIKTVPFMGAYANSIDVLARALIGGNIKGMNRKKAMKYLGGAFIALSSVSLLYAFVAGLDDDYWELDDQTRLRNVILPFSKKLTGEMIMMPMNTGAAFIFKAIPELIYNYVITKGTDKQIDKSRAAKAFGEAAIDSLLGPEPIPSAVKPIIEIGLNRNFFTGREMTPKGMEDLEAADQFTAATSELGKMMGSVTDKLNPIEADHLIRSIFGTVGAMVQWGSNLIFAASRPEMTIKELPVTGAFVAPKYPRGKEDLFYDFLERTRKKHATFTDRLDRMDVDSAVDYMEKNAGLIVLYDYASQLEAELKEINKDIRLYSRASQDLGLSSKERREIIDGLNIIKRGKLEGIEIFRNLSEEIKVTE